MADVIAENQAEIDRLIAMQTEAIAAKDAEILQLKQAEAQHQIDVDAAEVRGAKAILAELFRRFQGG